MMRIRHLSAAGLTLLALSLVPARAHAAPGISLAWDHCLAQGTGVQNKMFACNVNSGSHVAVGTFELTHGMVDFVATEIVIQLAAADGTLPAWWQLRSGDCRAGSLGVNNQANPDDVACPDWSHGNKTVALAAYCTFGDQCLDLPPPLANQAQILLLEAVPGALREVLEGAQPYFSFDLVLNNRRTVGTGSCSGCDIPVCIGLNSIKVYAQDNTDTRFISNPSVPGANFVTWQGGGPGCPGATPTRNATWGAVKSMYR